LHWAGHNNVNYRYTVDQKEYTGYGKRNWQDPRYSGVEIGGHCPVFFSASHPWLSSLYRPDGVLVGLPMALITLLLEIFAVATLINPKSGWAFRFDSSRRGSMFPTKLS
jgi:hypothetical protein